MVVWLRRALTTVALGGLSYFEPILVVGMLALAALALGILGWAMLGPSEAPTERIVRVITAVKGGSRRG